METLNGDMDSYYFRILLHSQHLLSLSFGLLTLLRIMKDLMTDARISEKNFPADPMKISILSAVMEKVNARTGILLLSAWQKHKK